MMDRFSIWVGSIIGYSVVGSIIGHNVIDWLDRRINHHS